MDCAKTPVPTNEAFRQAVLDGLRVLDTAPEEPFDRLTRLAARHFKTPIALVSLIDCERQWFKSRVGLEANETGRDAAFCAYAIMSDAPLIVLNATEDARFSDNPLVVGPPHIRFYAGAPLITKEGIRIGTFCIIDVQPRDAFGVEDREALKDFAATTMDMLYLREMLVRSCEDHERRIATAEYSANAGRAAKRQFMAVVGHELRTPLNAILGFGGLIASEIDGPLPNERYKTYLEAINSSGRRLMRTVETVLTYAQAERGEIALSESRFDLAPLIEECILPCLAEAQIKGVAVRNRMKDAPVPILEADRLHTEQMILQLLSNALKHTPAGGQIEISTSLDRDGLALIVRDTGSGVSPIEVSRAFAAFRQISEGLARTQEGVGLGLSLTKLLIELHGGAIALSPHPEGGTLAVLKFPRYRVSAAAEPDYGVSYAASVSA